MATLITLNHIENSARERVLAEIREIFFLSSNVTEFESKEKKENFYRRWLGYYLAHYSQSTWCALDEQGKVLAYLTVCLNTHEFLESYPLESLKLFKDFYTSYPAHLHMNTHPSARGQGLGAKLLALAIEHLRQAGISGLHLITGAGERNVGFYERCGFGQLDCQKFKGNEFLLLGFELST